MKKVKAKFGSLFKKAKKKWNKDVVLEEYNKVTKFFSVPRQMLYIGYNGEEVQYAIKGVTADMFQNFILSGKATLHELRGMILSDDVSGKDFDAQKAIIGICKTKHAGLVFYPATKKDYRKIVSFLREKRKSEIRQEDLAKRIRDIQAKQESDAANNQRMQKFIEEFVQEASESESPAPFEPSLHLDVDEPNTIDLKPELKL